MSNDRPSKRAAIVSFFSNIVSSSSFVASTCLDNHDERLSTVRTTYLAASGTIPPVDRCFWRMIDNDSTDEREFMHFIAFSRSSFNKLVQICADHLNSNPIRPSRGNTTHKKPSSCHLAKRKHSNRDIIAMTIKYMISTSEIKDLSPQFGATSCAYSDLVNFGKETILKCLINHRDAMVFWDRSLENLTYHASRTKAFQDCESVVAFIDGLMIDTLNDDDPVAQNGDYNKWKSDCFRKYILIWDTEGRCVDCGVNLPGSFHDSKCAFVANIYEHIAALPDGFVVVADSAFNTTHKLLEGKVVKAKYSVFHRDDEYSREDLVSERDSQLTSLRQAAEWGNKDLRNTFRRLKMKLKTDNNERALLLWTALLLHNYKLSTCVANQTRTYFDIIVDDCN